MRRRDILRMWAQIVQQTGIEKYTAKEWQENYEEFWKCMQSPTDPYIRIESVNKYTIGLFNLSFTFKFLLLHIDRSSA